jgi:hypothetical protein
LATGAYVEKPTCAAEAFAFDERKKCLHGEAGFFHAEPVTGLLASPSTGWKPNVTKL